jgi:diguanylate cyclase (GGDEF)-like protein
MDVSQFTQKEKLLKDGTFELEFSSRTGIVRLARVASKLTMDENGHPKCVLQLVTDITAEHAIQSRLVFEVQRMAKLAGQDALTGLPNRRAFDIVLEDAIASSDKRQYGVIVVDVDDFKHFNDIHGHKTGDLVLQEFAKRLQTGVRESDFVARIGGDEFGIVFAGIPQGRFEEMCRRLVVLLDFDTVLGSKHLHIIGSVGGAHSSQVSGDLVAQADKAMYEHKRGREARPAGYAATEAIPPDAPCDA